MASVVQGVVDFGAGSADRAGTASASRATAASNRFMASSEVAEPGGAGLHLQPREPTAGEVEEREDDEPRQVDRLQVEMKHSLGRPLTVQEIGPRAAA